MFSYALKHDKFDQVYCDRSFPPHLLVFMQFAWSPHVIYLCTYLLQLFFYALEHDKLDQVYCDRPYPPYLSVLCNFHGHLM